jgi:hypothetical protein
MSRFDRITIFQNRKRVNTLKQLNSYVNDYFSNIKRLMLGTEISENDEAKAARSKINLILAKAYEYMYYSGTNTSIHYTPPATTGGTARNIDLLQNVFNLHYYQLEKEQLTDLIERSIGTYENDKNKSIIRTFNPFFWLNNLVVYIVRIPFKIIGRIGFNQEKIETSVLGRIVKAILYAIVVFSAFLTALEKLNLLDSFRSLF